MTPRPHGPVNRTCDSLSSVPDRLASHFGSNGGLTSPPEAVVTARYPDRPYGGWLGTVVYRRGVPGGTTRGSGLASFTTSAEGPMHAFITGSRAYGEPRPDSDIDLVIRTDQATAEKLLVLAGGKLPIRFGNLNLIVCTSDEEFAVWRLGTTSMERGKIKEGPYTSEQAKAVLDVLRETVGIIDKADSGGTK